MLWIITSKVLFIQLSEGLLSTGVTSFLPTTLTSSYEQLLAVTENIGARYQEATGAKIRGIYLKVLILLKSIRELKIQLT